MLRDGIAREFSPAVVVRVEVKRAAIGQAGLKPLFSLGGNLRAIEDKFAAGWLGKSKLVYRRCLKEQRRAGEV